MARETETIYDDGRRQRLRTIEADLRLKKKDADRRASRFRDDMLAKAREHEQRAQVLRSRMKNAEQWAEEAREAADEAKKLLDRHGKKINPYSATDDGPTPEAAAKAEIDPDAGKRYRKKDRDFLAILVDKRTIDQGEYRAAADIVYLVEQVARAAGGKTMDIFRTGGGGGGYDGLSEAVADRYSHVYKPWREAVRFSDDYDEDFLCAVLFEQRSLKDAIQNGPHGLTGEWIVRWHKAVAMLRSALSLYAEHHRRWKRAERTESAGAER